MFNTASTRGTLLPSYLTPLQTALSKSKSPTEQQQIIAQYVGQSYFALFAITDDPIPSIVPVSGVNNSGATLPL